MTTIVSVRKDKKVVLGGDGQVTLGNTIIKHDVIKVRKIFSNRIICGLAGATADAYTIFESLEKKILYNNGNLIKSALSLIKDWKNDRFLRKLEAMLGVVDEKYSLIITGNGELIQPEKDIISVGSGGLYAKAAALALLENTKLNALDIVKKSLKIASNICIYTNDVFTIEQIDIK